LASNAIINSFQAQIFITPKSFSTSLDLKRGVGFVEMVLLFIIVLQL